MTLPDHALDSRSRLLGKFVGVVPAMSFQNVSYLKQLLLMFDRLALDLGTSGMSLVERRILTNASKDIEWLSREQLLTTLAGLAAGSDLGVRRAEVPVFGGSFIEAGIRGGGYLMGRVGGLHRVAAGSGLRYTASELRAKFGVDAVAVPPNIEVANADAPAGHEAVVRIALSEFPLPPESTPWQNIRDFRSDDGARSQFSRLKQWINRIGKAGLQEYEVSDHLRELLYEYEESMNLHKMKAQRGILEVLVTTTAEVAENLLRFKVSTAAKAIFAVKDHKLKLLEEEKKTVGREIAYIVSARRAFSATY